MSKRFLFVLMVILTIGIVYGGEWLIQNHTIHAGDPAVTVAPRSTPVADATAEATAKAIAPVSRAIQASAGDCQLTGMAMNGDYLQISTDAGTYEFSIGVSDFTKRSSDINNQTNWNTVEVSADGWRMSIKEAEYSAGIDLGTSLSFPTISVWINQMRFTLPLPCQ